MGILIAFEGPDGCGKTTISEEVVREITKHSFNWDKEPTLDEGKKSTTHFLLFFV